MKDFEAGCVLISRSALLQVDLYLQDDSFSNKEGPIVSFWVSGSAVQP
jgi:hypothetical protein